MDPVLIAEGIDAGVKLLTLWINSTGAQGAVSQTVAARIADGGRDWTDAERKVVTDALAASKAYAIEQANKPDASP